MSYVLDGVTYYTVRFLNYEENDLLGTCDVPAGGDATPYAPEPEEIEGMSFKGWNRSLTNIQNDKTVRPVYVPLYMVQFFNFEGTEAISIQKVAEGGSAIAPAPEVVDGYIFIGWSTSFRNVTADTIVYSRYRAIPPHPVLNFYKVNSDNTSGDFIKSYSGVNACTITQKLDGECTINLKMLTRQMEGYVATQNRLEVEGLVFHVTEIKKNISSGMCYTEMTGEHVSYILNNDEYMVTAFDMTGTPEEILDKLLEDTPFSIGVIEKKDKVTLRVNKEATRRACVMQLIALVDGEIEYYGYTIGIRNHLGSEEMIDVMKSANVRDISFSYNSTEQRYSYSLDLYQKGALTLGDELKLLFNPLGIDTHKRIVGMNWNPFNYKEVSITLGAYIPTLNDSLYELVNTVEDIRETTAKYTVEFGEMIGNGTFYFTRAYQDRPYFHIHTSDGSIGTVTLNRKEGDEFSSYIGATLSGVEPTTSTVLVFYCTVPDEQ